MHGLFCITLERLVIVEMESWRLAYDYYHRGIPCSTTVFCVYKAHRSYQGLSKLYVIAALVMAILW